MTPIGGMTLTEAEHAIEAAHPAHPWHLWHSDEGREYATLPESDLGGSGTTLSAASVERIEEAIGQWEWDHREAVTG